MMYQLAVFLIPNLFNFQQSIDEQSRVIYTYHSEHSEQSWEQNKSVGMDMNI